MVFSLFLETVMGLEQRIAPGTNPRIPRVVSKSDSDHRTATTAHRTLGLTPSGTICHSNVTLLYLPLANGHLSVLASGHYFEVPNGP